MHLAGQHFGLYYQCSQCPDQISSPYSLIRHLKSQHATSKTPQQCSAFLRLKNTDNAITDVLKAEKPQKRFPCFFEGCNESYTREVGRQEHMAITHTKIPLYTCFYGCGDTFFRCIDRLKHHTECTKRPRHISSDMQANNNLNTSNLPPVAIAASKQHHIANTECVCGICGSTLIDTACLAAHILKKHRINNETSSKS
jgi:hypothetical protein